MPINGAAITAAIIAAGPTLKGPDWFRVAKAVGPAVAVWARGATNVVLVGVGTGTVGGGRVTGKFLMAPAPLPVNAAMATAALIGAEAQTVATAIGTGVATSINATAAYRGQLTGAGSPGADASKVVFVNPATLNTLLNARLRLNGVSGFDARLLAAGLSLGISGMFLTGGGVGTIIGPGGPSPSVGASKSSLF